MALLADSRVYTEGRRVTTTAPKQPGCLIIKRAVSFMWSVDYESRTQCG